MARQQLQKCTACGEYGLSTTCAKCGERAQVASPLKWSPEDNLASRRRTMHKVDSKEWVEGLPE
ncbi:MAG TPA: ribosome biogenesis protein [Candidatus Poseidoniales archaeon]|jgi:rRNA maturation protein Nop10|nr:MAG: ribosome biogenesis protein [Euryarchaeota archaeon]HIG03584.1 ribosome biogenesis protein [Candidatus Poseidoniales archaeon]HIK78001.1 ribosome biogenesis protein [Candidatus Poseidoniales archaeon]